MGTFAANFSTSFTNTLNKSKVSSTAPEAPDFDIATLTKELEDITKEFENFSVQPTSEETITDEHSDTHQDENNSFEKQKQELESRKSEVSDRITESRDQLEERQADFFERVKSFREGLEHQVSGLTKGSAERFSKEIRERGVNSTDINKFRGDRKAQAEGRATKLREELSKKGIGRRFARNLVAKTPKKKAGERINKLGE